MVSTKTNAVIREATEKDIEGIINVNCRSLHTEEVNGLVQKRSVEEFQKLLRISKKSFVAECEGKIVGYAIILDESAPYSENEIFLAYTERYSNFVFIDSLAIQPDFRRKGIGSAFYGAYLPEEKKRVLADIFAEPENPVSVMFHESLGFVSTGDLIHLKNGMVVEVFEYRKE